MNDTGSGELSNADADNVEEVILASESSVHVRGIVKNEIVVETDTGLIRMPVKTGKADMSQTLLDDDFDCSGTELFFKEEDTSLSDSITFLVENDIDDDGDDDDDVDEDDDDDVVESRLVSNNNNNNNNNSKTRKFQSNTNKISILYSVPEVPVNKSSQSHVKDEFAVSEESLIRYSTLNYPLFDKSMEQIDEILSVADVRVPGAAGKGAADSGKKPLTIDSNNKKSLILKNNAKAVISVKNVVNNYSSGSCLAFKSSSSSSSSSTSKCKVPGSVGKAVESHEETSDNSEVNVARAAAEPKPAKRGGWPKGRKRKPEVKSETRPPKAPATAYVIFLNERRKDFKDIPFTEVTKLLGHEWSRLSLQEKKVYLEQAEVEKKRYREELKFYRQSDAYQTYLHKKRLKRLQGNGTEESDMDATDEIDDEDNEELYCRTCDQWFHSLHNKKEHLYGRQHLQSIAGRYSKTSDPDWRNPNMSSTSFDESSLDGSSYLKGAKDQCCNKYSWSLNMDEVIVRFMAANQEREEERRLLKKKLDEVRARNVALTLSLQECNKTLNSLTCMAESERTTQILLEQRLFNLLNVPTLFYLPEPLNEENN